MCTHGLCSSKRPPPSPASARVWAVYSHDVYVRLGLDGGNIGLCMFETIIKGLVSMCIFQLYFRPGMHDLRPKWEISSFDVFYLFSSLGVLHLTIFND